MDENTLNSAKTILANRYPDLRIVSGFFVDGVPIIEAYRPGKPIGVEFDPYYSVDIRKKAVYNYAVTFDTVDAVLSAERKYYMEESK